MNDSEKGLLKFFGNVFYIWGVRLGKISFRAYYYISVDALPQAKKDCYGLCGLGAEPKIMCNLL